MKKVKHIFSRKIVNDNFTTIRNSTVYLPLTKEEKLKVMGEDYDLGSSFKFTHENGEVDIGFNINDYGSYRIALPGEKVQKVIKYDNFGNEIK